MEENMMEMTNEVVDVVDTMEEVTETVAESNGGLASKILTGLGLIGACVGGAVLFKNRGKIKEKKLKKMAAKLEKAGYVVLSEPEIDDLTDLDDLDEKETEE